jgi:hypothetical protein
MSCFDVVNYKPSPYKWQNSNSGRVRVLLLTGSMLQYEVSALLCLVRLLTDAEFAAVVKGAVDLRRSEVSRTSSVLFAKSLYSTCRRC